jgi:hypothetical protein
MKSSIFRHFMVLGMLALGLPACVGEAIDANEEEVDQAEEALCDIDLECNPIPQSKPNLTVVSPTSGCGLVDPYTARVRVKNSGTAWAGSSKTRLMFLTDYYAYSYYELVQSTPSLSVNGTVDLYFTAPFSCIDWGCEVFVDVDWLHQISESSESNSYNWMCD